jgi:hypothetical protein
MSIVLSVFLNEDYKENISLIVEKIKCFSFLNLNGIFLSKNNNELKITFSENYDRHSYLILLLVSKMISNKFSKKEYNHFFKTELPYYYFENKKYYIINEKEYVENYENLSVEYLYSYSVKKIVKTSENINFIKTEKHKDIEYFSFDYLPEQINHISFLQKKLKLKKTFFFKILGAWDVIIYPFILNKSKRIFNKISNI